MARRHPTLVAFMKSSCKMLVLLAGGWILAACAGGNKKSEAAAAAAAADMAKAQQQALEMNRMIKQDEFVLTLVADDPAVAQIATVNIDVISTDARNAARLAADGPVKYRDSRIRTNAARTHTFRKGGSYVVKVPSITPADSIVLWAELPAPGKGGDTRMLVIPLELDKSDPVKGPVAKPITVKLTANGWVRGS